MHLCIAFAWNTYGILDKLVLEIKGKLSFRYFYVFFCIFHTFLNFFEVPICIFFLPPPLCREGGGPAQWPRIHPSFDIGVLLVGSIGDQPGSLLSPRCPNWTPGGSSKKGPVLRRMCHVVTPPHPHSNPNYNHEISIGKTRMQVQLQKQNGCPTMLVSVVLLILIIRVTYQCGWCRRKPWEERPQWAMPQCNAPLPGGGIISKGRSLEIPVEESTQQPLLRNLTHFALWTRLRIF